jgi:hypothetical protein
MLSVAVVVEAIADLWGRSDQWGVADQVSVTAGESSLGSALADADTAGGSESEPFVRQTVTVVIQRVADLVEWNARNVRIGEGVGEGVGVRELQVHRGVDRRVREVRLTVLGLYVDRCVRPGVRADVA